VKLVVESGGKKQRYKEGKMEKLKEGKMEK